VVDGIPTQSAYHKETRKKQRAKEKIKGNGAEIRNSVIECRKVFKKTISPDPQGRPGRNSFYFTLRGKRWR